MGVCVWLCLPEAVELFFVYDCRAVVRFLASVVCSPVQAIDFYPVGSALWHVAVRRQKLMSTVVMLAVLTGRAFG